MYKYYNLIAFSFFLSYSFGEVRSEEVNHTVLPCKEESFRKPHRFTPFYFMDNESLNHVTVRRDSAGLLTYFEMHVAIQADRDVYIHLWDKVDRSVIQYNIYIGWDSNRCTYLLSQEGRWIQQVHSPDILSSTQFRAFYVKVADGKVQFGKEGDSRPVISYNDARVSSLNYFWFYYGAHNTARIRYDCPNPGQERS